MAKKTPIPPRTKEDPLRPFWFDLPTQFYERVNKAAEEFGITRKELVSRAVYDFIEEHRKEKRRTVLPTTAEQEELVKDFQRRAGSLRWKDVTTEERREMMRKISAARWGTKKKAKKKGQVGS